MKERKINWSHIIETQRLFWLESQKPRSRKTYWINSVSHETESNLHTDVSVLIYTSKPVLKLFSGLTQHYNKFLIVFGVGVYLKGLKVSFLVAAVSPSSFGPWRNGRKAHNFKPNVLKRVITLSTMKLKTSPPSLPILIEMWRKYYFWC